MFCYQCQEAANGSGCEIKGVCGKAPETAQLQDVLLHTARGVAVFAAALPEVDAAAGRWVLDALFTTITNANFDNEQISAKIRKGLEIRTQLADACAKAEVLPAGRNEHAATFAAFDIAEMLAVAPQAGVLRSENEDVRSLRELLTYGLKGLAAYVWHAMEAGKEDPALVKYIMDALVISLLEEDANALTGAVLKTGEMGVQGMALLDGANTSRFGNPEITQVRTDAGNRPGILISGHDLVDLEQLLEQSKDAGVDIYTHSEMLPAHYYPAFKKYEHFYGNYGNAWWKQVEEFESFNGPILFTTNCIVPPKGQSTYTDRVFTTGASGFPGFKHIEPGPDGKKDFSEIIELAKNCQAPEKLEDVTLVGGFAHNQVKEVAGKVLDAVNSGAIKKFVVMAGCDGRMKSRSYYTDYAQDLEQDAVILTAGCAKYRYNKLDLGDIGGIPRVLDAGQCNDSYSLAVTALTLKDALGLEDINDLPIEYNIAWYEQKAVIVLLALLHLGVKNIKLGPTLPAFLSPGVAQVLVDTFGLGLPEGLAQAS
jgi:hydroxylamine reductase